MKTLFKMVSIGVLMFGASLVMAATFTLVSKEQDPAGYRYTYKYSCLSRAEGSFSVIAKNDEEVKKLAEAKARRVCEE
jgi:hypothetical protein